MTRRQFGKLTVGLVGLVLAIPITLLAKRPDSPGKKPPPPPPEPPPPDTGVIHTFHIA